MADDVDGRLILALQQNDETRDVEYKAAMAWNEKDKAACCGVVKDILAMANMGGGLIIIGVDQMDNGSFKPTGLPDHMLGSWETTRVNNFVQRYADPPINTRTRRFSDAGMTFIALDVPPFPSVPHLCMKDYPGELQAFALYVRTANNESAPIKSSADFDAIIERAVRNRSERLLSSIRTILVGADITATVSDTERFAQQLEEAQQRAIERYPREWPTYEGYREIAWWPARFDEERFALEELRPAVNAARVSYRAQPFLAADQSRDAIQSMQDGIEAITGSRPLFPEPMRLDYHAYDYWQFRTSGFFFKSSLMKEEGLTPRINDKLILWDEMTAFMGEGVDALVRLYEALGVMDEDVTVQVRVTGTQGRTVGVSGIWLPTIHERCSLPEVRYRATHSIDEWAAGRVDLAARMTREIMLRFNWMDAPTFEAPIRQLFDYQLRP